MVTEEQVDNAEGKVVETPQGDKTDPTKAETPQMIPMEQYKGLQRELEKTRTQIRGLEMASRNNAEIMADVRLMRQHAEATQQAMGTLIEALESDEEDITSMPFKKGVLRGKVQAIYDTADQGEFDLLLAGTGLTLNDPQLVAVKQATSTKEKLRMLNAIMPFVKPKTEEPKPVETEEQIRARIRAEERDKLLQEQSLKGLSTATPSGTIRTFQELEGAYANNPNDKRLQAAYFKARGERGL